VSTQPLIRVLIADDQDMVRSGLDIGLSTFDDLEVIASVGSSQEAIRLCQTLQPDVVLMDIMFSGKPDGILAAHAIHQSLPHIHIVALSGFSSFELVQEALHAGVTSYLFKSVTIDELAGAIRSAHVGKMVLSPEIVRDPIQLTKRLPLFSAI
jgi:NarL family two-component system response regulator LiaR